MTEQASLLGAGGPPSRPGKTNGALVEAIALYRSAGYAEVAPFNDEPYAQHWFEKGIGDVESRAAAATFPTTAPAGGAPRRREP